MNKLLNTLKITCSVIGGVIGAGFISGREIMTFFYGYNKFYCSIILFVIFFLLIYLILRLKSSSLLYIIKRSNVIILLFNILIMASMLAATDSLVESLFGISKNIPIFSIGLLLLSTLCCLGGFSSLAKVNLVIIPVLILIFFSAIFIIPANGENYDTANSNFYSCLSYSCLNIFLVQPFLLKIKEERSDFSPLGVAFLSSLILVLAIFAFLGVLSEDCISCDIPLILLAKNNLYLYYLLSLIIFIGIFTTLTAVQYPFYGIIKGGSASLLIVVSIVGFAISRIGFYHIVDKLYPTMSVLAIVYYLILIAISLFFSLKGQHLHTLTRREGTKLRY